MKVDNPQADAKISSTLLFFFNVCPKYLNFLSSRLWGQREEKVKQVITQVALPHTTYCTSHVSLSRRMLNGVQRKSYPESHSGD
jgi:hypothetical protein